MFFIIDMWQNLSDTCASFLCIMPCSVAPVVSSVKLWCFWNLRHRTLTWPGQVLFNNIHLQCMYNCLQASWLTSYLGYRGGAVTRTLTSHQCGARLLGRVLGPGIISGLGLSLFLFLTVWDLLCILWVSSLL